jgi:solute:Na+ symporter, SSS family
MSITFVVLLAYLCLQFGIGYYISKRIHSESDYFVAGRSFPLIVVSVSLFATWFGAETTIGSSGAVYAEGVSGSRADPFGYALCLFLSGTLIARKIWNKNYITLSDFYRERYGVPVEQLAVWVLSISSLIWAAAQLRAFGQVISASTSLDLNVTLLLAFICVVSYTLLGGLMGDMITDLVQAIVIAFGLILLLVIVIGQVPNFSETLLTQSPERWSLRGVEESWAMRVERWAIPILGSLVAQEIISRLFSARTQAIAVQACYVGAAIYLGLGLIPVVLGMVGPELIQVDGDPEQFLIQLAQTYLSPVLLGIFMGAIISALLATIDSILLAVGALVGHNFLIPTIGVRSERAKLLLSRGVVLGAGFVVYILAVQSTGIYDLLEAASSFGTSGLLVITLVGLWSRFGDQWTALITLIVGIIATPIAEYAFELETPFLVSLACASLCFIGMTLYRRKLGGL